MSNNHVHPLFAAMLDDFEKVIVAPPSVATAFCTACGAAITGARFAEVGKCYVCAPGRTGWEDFR